MPGRKHSDRRKDEPAALAAAARRLADDPVDQADMQAVSEDMDALAADWPNDNRAREGERCEQPCSRPAAITPLCDRCVAARSWVVLPQADALPAGFIRLRSPESLI